MHICQGNHFDRYGGASNLAELNCLLRATVMVRRLKRDVLAQLPSKRRQQVGWSHGGSLHLACRA
jgi:SWI/SNF-related matrix-associated actin-dependent regulator 1 of chromatin subfamily A